MGSGIAVTTVGNAAPRVVERAAEQLTRYTHLVSWPPLHEPYIEVAEALNRLTRAIIPSAPRCSTPAPRPWRTR